MILKISRVHRAGPREKIYFKPEEVKAAIVTCGGLCPGLNDVIRQVIIITPKILNFFSFLLAFISSGLEVLFDEIIILIIHDVVVETVI